jgi:uncharacterized protein
MKIPILHLPDGIHHFDQTINSESLNFSRQEVYPNPLHLAAGINKFGKNIQCRVTMRTTASYICDRCLVQYDKPFDFQFGLLFHMGKDDLETAEEDVVLLPVETIEVDLAEWITENLILEIPIKSLCREDCKGICPHCGANLNHDSCQCGKEAVDPRWEKLKDLLK